MLHSEMVSLLLVVVLVIGLVGAETTNCMERIREIESKSGRGRLMGGYTPIENPEENDIVASIVKMTVEEFGNRQNGLLKFKFHEIISAFTQLVNGLKFCVEFTLTSDGCKNNSINDYCQKEERYSCVVSAYKAFTEENATIDRAALSCIALQ